jgi:23S rRNA pseudouridine1911/1915/1917 synthase
MKKQQKTAEIDDLNRRLDVFIHVKWPDISRSLAQNLCENKAVTVDGVFASKNHRMRVGEVVEVAVPTPVSLCAMPEDLPIDVVFQDEHLMVVDKPRAWWSILPRKSRRYIGKCPITPQ